MFIFLYTIICDQAQYKVYLYYENAVTELINVLTIKIVIRDIALKNVSVDKIRFYYRGSF